MKPHNRKLLTQSLPSLQPTTTTPSPQPGQSMMSEPSPLPSQPPVEATVMLFVLIGFFLIGFIMTYFCTRYFCANSDAGSAHRRHQRGLLRTASSPLSDLPPRSSNLRKGVDPVMIRAMPMYSYRGDAKYQIDCAICLSEFEEKEAVKVIPFCKHVFHPECIDMWLTSHMTCPVCRATRFSDEVEEGSGRSTVKNHDACIDGIRVVGSFSFGMRRNSSCSNLGDRAVLQRTSSF